MNLKVANQDTEFEQSFFQLAYEKLQAKLSNLLPFLVGFEIVNKSDDGTKALGVFGFKSNNGQIIYVPAFFVNGTVKGIDILYSKNNEQFYPLNEDFAELFLKNDSTGLGEASHESEKQINQSTQAVDLRDLVRPPRTGKVSYASVMDFVEEGDELTKEAFQTLFSTNDEFMESVLRFYPVEKIAKALAPKDKEEKEKPTHPALRVLALAGGGIAGSISGHYIGQALAEHLNKTAGVLSITTISVKDLGESKDLEPAHKDSLLTKGYAIVDNRTKDQKSKFGLVKYPEKFTNPTNSGFYSYLTETGGLHNGLIITKPHRLDINFATDEAIIIDLDAKQDGQGYRTMLNDVYVRNHYTVKDYSEVHKKMTELAEAEPSFDETYILLNERLVATQPFRITANFKDDTGLRKITVEPTNRGDGWDSNTVGTTTLGRKLKGNFYQKNAKPHSINLVLTKRPGDALSYSNNEILIPKGFKLFSVKLRAPFMNYDDEDGSRAERERYYKGKPGGLGALNAALGETKVFPLSVRSNGSEYFVNIGATKKKYKNAISAKIALVTEIGLDEKVAEELVDSVPDMGRRAGYVKLAYTGDYTSQLQDPQPYSNELGQPTYDGMGQQDVAQGQEYYQGDPTRLGLGTMPQVQGLDSAVNRANQLAQAGQKEIFDTHSIATLAKYVSPGAKVQGYMPDFVSCLDKLGRMLFLVYWETEKFEEMYGRGELPELVELLTDVFKNLGDLVIFLKCKSPEISINMEKDELSV